MFDHIKSLSLLALCLVSSAAIVAEEKKPIQFHIIKDGTNKHISMIPPQGYNQDGKIHHNFNPNSVVYQHAALLESLRQEQAELDRRAEEEALKELQQEQTDQDTPSIIQRAKQEGNVFFGRANRGVLDDLIQLEKRAGRAEAE